MLKKLVLSVVVAVVTGVVVWLVGLAIEQVPAVRELGIGLQSVSWVLGFLAGVWYYLTNKTVF